MEEIRINKDTQLCMSLAARPGNFGTRFHNFLYRELGLNYIYKAFTTRDLAAAIGGIRALGIRGCAISMPFKEACIQYLDELDSSARGIMSVNTIVNSDGYLKAFNTDYTAVFTLIRSAGIPETTRFALRGSGGMAKAVACALKDAGFANGIIVARNETAGAALAEQYGFEWKRELENETPGLLINVTPIGMAGGTEADQLVLLRRVDSRGPNGLRCRGPSRRNTAHSVGEQIGKEDDQRCRGDRASSRRTICALHRRPTGD